MAKKKQKQEFELVYDPTNEINTYVINPEKIKTLEDVIVILRALNLQLTWQGQDVPAQFRELAVRNMLTKVTVSQQ